MFKRTFRDPLRDWVDSPSRLGWSVLDGRLVEARAIKDGRLLQLRHSDDGSFLSPKGFTPQGLNQLANEERWLLGPSWVEGASGGSRVATVHNPVLGLMIDANHGNLMLYRIAHGMLYPDGVLLETLAMIPHLSDDLERIDLDRVRAEVPGSRVPTEAELDETGQDFMRREAKADSVEVLAELDDLPQEIANRLIMERWEELAENNPFALDGAPYLKD